MKIIYIVFLLSILLNILLFIKMKQANDNMFNPSVVLQDNELSEGFPSTFKLNIYDNDTTNYFKITLSESGVIYSIVTYKESAINGPLISFKQTGKLSKIGKFYNSFWQETWMLYDNDGIKQKTEYVDGLRHGMSVVFKGNLIDTLMYKNDSLVTNIN